MRLGKDDRVEKEGMTHSMIESSFNASVANAHLCCEELSSSWGVWKPPCSLG